MAHILVVDDDPIVRRMLSLMLQRSSHSAVPVESGEDALESLRDEAFDLVITDLDMPDMNGIELLRQVRRDERLRSLPVIMLTASAEDQDDAIARAEGVSAFLTKPAGSQELTETVNRVLSQ
jgi:CheY-like chemotaxis protein